MYWQDDHLEISEVIDRVTKWRRNITFFYFWIWAFLVYFIFLFFVKRFYAYLHINGHFFASFSRQMVSLFGVTKKIFVSFLLVTEIKTQNSRTALKKVHFMRSYKVRTSGFASFWSTIACWFIIYDNKFYPVNIIIDMKPNASILKALYCCP